MRRLLTVQADDAHQVATTDRAGTADMVLDQACKAAVESLRRGRPGYAEYQLARAGERAGRILGGGAPEMVAR